jgi:hypothetical protein
VTKHYSAGCNFAAEDHVEGINDKPLRKSGSVLALAATSFLNSLENGIFET